MSDRLIMAIIRCILSCLVMFVGVKIFLNLGYPWEFITGLVFILWGNNLSIQR